MTDNKIQKKKTAQLWKQNLEVIEQGASQSETVTRITNMTQFWQREVSRSEIVACAKNMPQFWQREASRSEIVAFATELINQNKRLIEKVRQLSYIRDRLCSSLENLVVEVRDIGEDGGQTMERAVEEDKPKALTSSIPITEVSGIKSNPEMESLIAKQDIESEFTPLSASKSQTVEKIIDSADKLSKSVPPLDDSPLFQGEIEITMAPPLDMAQLIRFERDLRSIPRLSISRTSGSQNGCTIITVIIAEPLPLISLLKRMPEVEKAEVWAGEKADDNAPSWRSMLDYKPESCQERIVVTLNHSACKATQLGVSRSSAALGSLLSS